MIINNITELISVLDKNTKKIRLGVFVYNQLKSTLGRVATKIKGIDFELDENLEEKEVVIEKNE